MAGNGEVKRNAEVSVTEAVRPRGVRVRVAVAAVAATLTLAAGALLWLLQHSL